MDYPLDVMTIVDLVRDMILAAAGVLVLVVLNRANANKSRVPPRVWPFILVGFFLLLFGLLEYGWLFFKYQQIAGAARHGCRIGVAQGKAKADVDFAVDDLMTKANLTGLYNTNIDPAEPLIAAPGSTVTRSADARTARSPDQSPRTIFHGDTATATRAPTTSRRTPPPRARIDRPSIARLSSQLPFRASTRTSASSAAPAASSICAITSRSSSGRRAR